MEEKMSDYIISERQIFDWVLQDKITKQEADIIRPNKFSNAIQAEREKMLNELQEHCRNRKTGYCRYIDGSTNNFLSSKEGTRVEARILELDSIENYIQSLRSTKPEGT